MSAEVMGSGKVKGSPNGAKKCYEFGHRNKAGEPCGANVVAGTTGCTRHAGKTRAKAKAQGAVVVELKRWGLDSQTELADPGETLLRLVTQSRARCELYAGLLEQAYDAAERLKAAHAAGDVLQFTDPEVEWDADQEREIPEDPAAQVARADLERIFNTGGVAALIGNRYDADRDGRIYAVDEGIRGLAKLEADERDRCANFAAKAVAAGLAERQVRLAERQGAALFGVIAAVIRKLGRDPAEAAMRAVVAEAIQAVTGVAPANVIEGATA